LTVDRHTHPSVSTGAALQHCLSDVILGWGAGASVAKPSCSYWYGGASLAYFRTARGTPVQPDACGPTLMQGDRRCRSFGSVAEGVPIASANSPGPGLAPVSGLCWKARPRPWSHISSACGQGLRRWASRRGPVWILSFKMEMKRPWRSK
jgi:hypothetical protein